MKYGVKAKIIALFCVGVILLSSCASKRYGNKARKLDEAGLFSEAARMYYESVVANGNNVESKIGLQRSGQLVLVEKLNTFKNQYKNGSHRDAVYSYLDAEKYFKQIGGVGVNLVFPADNTVFYQESKEIFLGSLYQDALKALDVEQFAQAEQMLNEIISIDRIYKDAYQHWVSARYEPVYRQGNMFLDNQLYRKAFLAFSEIAEGASVYKDVVSLKAQALEKATITIAVAPFVLANNLQGTSSEVLRAKTIGSLNNLKSPFYKVVYDAGINSLKGDWLHSFQTVVIQYIQKNRYNISASTVLTCQVLKVNEHAGQLKKSTLPGYLKREEEYKDNSGISRKRTVYDKTEYQSVEQLNVSQMEVRFELIKVSTGEVLVSDVLSASYDSQLNYAEFKGEKKNLVPGIWKLKDKQQTTDKVFDDASSVKALQELLQAPKTHLSASDLMNKAVATISARMAGEIEKFNPEA